MTAMRLRNSVFSIAEHVPRKQMQLPLAQSEKRTIPAKRLYTMLIRDGIASRIRIPGEIIIQTINNIALISAASSRKTSTRLRGSGREKNCSRSDESFIPGRASYSGEDTVTYSLHDPGRLRSPSAAPGYYPGCCLSCRSGSQAYACFQYPTGFSSE